MIYVLPNALLAIKKSVLASRQEFEVGGILLGRKNKSTFFVDQATFPVTFEGCQRGSFSLNGEEATAVCRRIMEKSPNLQIIGIWHSHLYGIKQFSSQDQMVNRYFAGRYSGCVSALAVQRKNQIEICFFNLDQSGSVISQKEEIIMENTVLQCAYQGECCKDCRFYVDGYCQCNDSEVRPFATACADFEEM